MSVQAMSAVIDSSEHKGSNLLVLLMIANHAGNDVWVAWPSVALLSRETRLSERTVQYCLRRLEASGELGKEPGGPHGTTLWTIYLPTRGANIAGVQPEVEGGASDDIKGRNPAHQGVQPVAPEPSLTIIEPSGTLAPRKRDALFEALYLAQTLTPYVDGVEVSARERAKINTAAADLRMAGFGAEDVERAITGWPAAMGESRISALGLSANFTRCLNAANGATPIAMVRRMTEVERAIAEYEKEMGGDDG